MTATTRLALLVLGLGLILGSALASPYPFGTKVLPTDIDFGRPLRSYAAPNPLPDFSVGYWETGVVNGYDDTDVVYLHQGLVAGPGAPGVFANDVRLTPFTYLPAGSKVTPSDNDIGMLLSPLPISPPSGPFPAIGWVNLYGGPGHDLQDPVYLHQGNVVPAPIPTIANDVRLTAIGGNQPGTKVGNLDPDLPLIFANPIPLTSPNFITLFVGLPATQFPTSIAGAAIRYVDINGNSQYDYPDDVYLITDNPLPAPPAILAVRVNDLRLSAPVS